MSAILLNGTAYSALAFADGSTAPVNIDVKRTRIGTLLIGYDGTRTWMHRATTDEWTIAWEGANTTTRDALRAIVALSVATTFVDQDGASHSVHCEEDDYSETVSTIAASGDLYYDITLTFHET